MGRIALSLEQVGGVYARLMDDRRLPESVALREGAPGRAQCRALHDAISRLIALTPARVVNPTVAMGSNGSKPYQAQLIARHGFRVPETIITNDPDRVLEFQAQHDRVIYKSASGIRSIVRVLGPADLESAGACPLVPNAVPGVCHGHRRSRTCDRSGGFRHRDHQRRDRLSGMRRATGSPPSFGPSTSKTRSRRHAWPLPRTSACPSPASICVEPQRVNGCALR